MKPGNSGFHLFWCLPLAALSSSGSLNAVCLSVMDLCEKVNFTTAEALSQRLQSTIDVVSVVSILIVGRIGTIAAVLSVATIVI